MIGRFINADSYVSTGQGFLGLNMYAYCLNNPVNYVDYSGDDAVAIQTVQQWWTSAMWWLCAVDTALPVGDAVYLGGIIVFGLLSIPFSTPIEVPQMVIDQPVPETENNTKSGYDKAVEKLTKAIDKVKVRIKNESGRYHYWVATYVKYGYGLTTYIPTSPLTYETALKFVRAGGRVFADSKAYAYILALRVGNGAPPIGPERHRAKNGSTFGYWFHYHGANRGGHIFYVF